MSWIEDAEEQAVFARLLTTRELIGACCARYYADGAFRARYERVAYPHLTGVKGAWHRFWLRRGAAFIGWRQPEAGSVPISDDVLIAEVARQRAENEAKKEAERDG